MAKWVSCDAVERRPEKLGDALLFTGTRVLVSVLFENLKDGATVDEFPAWFPGVEAWQVSAVLENEAKSC